MEEGEKKERKKERMVVDRITWQLAGSELYGTIKI